MAAARRVLDADHFGLEKVKERILEFLAVKQLAPELKGQIICLVGPPGVGKTSIAMSVARAMNRKLARISLGGVHDEAEIRGHRKTYVGAMPGRIIAAIQQAGSCNPLLLLDEIDKLGSRPPGRPRVRAAGGAGQRAELLPSGTIFWRCPLTCPTCCSSPPPTPRTPFPGPLLDRMEVIELSSYTDEEKLQIAKTPPAAQGAEAPRPEASAQLKVTDGAMREIIAGYTRESGVRVLERQLAALCRKAAMRLVADGCKVDSRYRERLWRSILGVRRYPPGAAARRRSRWAWSTAWPGPSVGGELLEVEVNVVPGSGKVELTGNLGDVMKESAHAALSLYPQPRRPAGH